MSLHLPRPACAIVVAMVAAFLLALAPVPAAAQAGTYASAGAMTKKRDLHTMTVLPNGTILIVGGEDPFDYFGAWNDAEIYDPAAGTFTAVASLMSAERAEHTVTLLLDGKLLIAGGQHEACCQFTGAYGPAPTETADVYNPATQTFTQVGSMTTPRREHSAVRLADGRVLVVGGFLDINIAGAPPPSASAEIYNPATQTFVATGSMTIPRAAASMILLPGGKVLVLGGGGTATSLTAELFDPATATFAATTHAPLHGTSDAGLFLMTDNTVLILGSGSAVDRYDPAADTFTNVGTLLNSYTYHDAKIILTDGRFLLAGEHHSEVYDPATNTSVNAGDPGVDLFPAGAPLPGGRALVAGGESFVPFTFITTDAANIFMPASNRPPVANPGANQAVSPGAACIATVMLDGSASSDPDGDTLTYSWAEGSTVLGTTAMLTVSLGAGTHTIALRVDDGHGGTDTKSVAVTVTDTTAPSFIVPLAVTLEQAGPGGTLYTPMLPMATDNCDAHPAVTIAGVPAGSLFPAGTTSLTYTATDASANVSSAQTTVTVSDTTAPALALPSDVIAEATSASGATVSYSVSATDAVTAAPAVSCTPSSGSLFAIATTTVNCSATDAAGNSSHGMFHVTVRDTTAPVIHVPANIVAQQTGPLGAPVTYVVTATDAVTVSPAIVCAPASGSIFAPGATVVHCTATDAAGNSAPGSFTVTVRDTIAPAIVITSPAPHAYLLMQSVLAAYSCADSGSGIASCAGPVASGSAIGTSTLGNHTFTVTATDRAGNVSSASVTYSVAGINGKMTGDGGIAQNGLKRLFQFIVADDGDHDRDDGAALAFKAERRQGNDHDYDDRHDNDRRDDDRYGDDHRDNDHHDDDHHGDDHRTVWDEFVSIKATSVGFWHDPSFRSGQGQQPAANSVAFSGVGNWNGRSGYAFTAQASDRGEPGQRRDMFAITIYASNGAVVATVNGVITDGNIQTLPVHGH